MSRLLLIIQNNNYQCEGRYVCVCVWERERERERVCVRVRVCVIFLFGATTELIIHGCLNVIFLHNLPPAFTSSFSTTKSYFHY